MGSRTHPGHTGSRDPVGWLLGSLWGGGTARGEDGHHHQDIQATVTWFRCWQELEPRRYLVFVAPIVEEGFPNKSTPDELGVAMLYLQDRNDLASSETQPGTKPRTREESHSGQRFHVYGQNLGPMWIYHLAPN